MIEGDKHWGQKAKTADKHRSGEGLQFQIVWISLGNTEKTFKKILEGSMGISHVGIVQA